MKGFNYSGLNGIALPAFNDPALQALATQQAQQTGTFDWNKFLDTATKIGMSAAQVINSFKQSGQMAVVNGQVVPASGYLPPPPPPQTDNTMKIVLIGGGIAVAALATWAIVSASQNNNKKK